MKKILIPVDSSKYAKRAVEQGIKMAKAFGSQVVLLYVANIIINYSRYEINLPQDSLLAVIEEEKKYAEAMLNSFKETFGDMADKVEIVILEGNAVDEIVDYAKESDIDMIIVGSHGTGSILRKNSLGSVASKVLHYVDKPVLVVK
ncbi:MAG TPA: universal stress protein [Anaerovoracaceae bacterium]|nr:universal stress protein [Anaerovoracaceae bacterium]